MRTGVIKTFQCDVRTKRRRESFNERRTNDRNERLPKQIVKV